ncbi:carbohydrate kinase family protein [Candidatus Contubernalis alkaliaceticus]|uniref:carbohydrate kinase family protein n=1 Tax=Candidatus Contubernalis alkaliaceticus TaxID=338645 RepID=UPI002409E8DC|nr:carbohydrate kinase family protein [Candidatus Contubernalis alkalaceticus]UNC91509.1 carbohydrate kinase family protein [Candidatus Contubernalis alkalaceticus]
MLGKVYGFGALNVDLIFQIPKDTAEKLPYQPGCEYVEGPSEAAVLLKLLSNQGILKGRYGGGSAANTTVALSRLGVSCGFIGRVGEDPEGDFLLESLEDVDKGNIVKGGRSGLCITLLLGDSKDRSLVICPNANDQMDYNDLTVNEINEEAACIHLTSFHGDKPFEAQCRLIEQLPPGVKVSFDPGMFYARRGMDSLEPLISRANYFFPEKKEVELLTGRPWREGASELLKMGPEVILCTLGEAGVFVLHSSGEFTVPALKVPVVDTTGAGDVFAAGFTAARLEGNSLRDSVKRGIYWAGRSVTGMGREKYPLKL